PTGTGAWIRPNVRPTASTTSFGTQAAANSGKDGDDITSAQVLGNQANKTGMYALENADLFNLLVIPPYSATADIDSAVWTAAAAYCETRRAFLLVDAPSSWNNKATAKAGIASPGVGTTSKNSAIFFPRIREPNPLKENQLEAYAPAGAIAGVFAR